MKKYACFALAFVLTAALFTGCGCTNRNMDNATVPTVLPTTNATTEATQATTEMTTAPTYATHTTEETTDRGNGALEDNTTGVTEGTMEGRARQSVPNAK